MINFRFPFSLGLNLFDQHFGQNMVSIWNVLNTPILSSSVTVKSSAKILKTFSELRALNRKHNISRNSGKLWLNFTTVSVVNISEWVLLSNNPSTFCSILHNKPYWIYELPWLCIYMKTVINMRFHLFGILGGSCLIELIAHQLTSWPSFLARRLEWANWFRRSYLAPWELFGWPSKSCDQQNDHSSYGAK